MKQLFLYRLFKHSPRAFAFVVFFIVFYGIVFYKKMDMVFFPYNSMYTIDFAKTNTAVTYGMKINGSIIKITDHLYWKKDFLETSLFGYCKYIRNDSTVFLDNYLHQKFSNERMRRILFQGLTPGKAAVMNWPGWYARFAGKIVPTNATIELMQYNFRYERGVAVLTDSMSIYKIILP